MALDCKVCVLTGHLMLSHFNPGTNPVLRRQIPKLPENEETTALISSCENCRPIVALSHFPHRRKAIWITEIMGMPALTRPHGWDGNCSLLSVTL
jgi:hypothetical protein